MIVAVAMRLLDDDFILHPGNVRQTLDELRILTRDAGRSPDGQRGGCSGSDHHRVAPDQRSKARADSRLQIIERDKLFRRVFYRRHNLRFHQRCGQDGVRAGGVDEWADVQFFEEVALICGGRNIA